MEAVSGGCMVTEGARLPLGISCALAESPTANSANRPAPIRARGAFIRLPLVRLRLICLELIRPKFIPKPSLLRHLALLSEGLLNIVFNFRAANQAEHPVHDLAVAADVEGGRKIRNAAILVAHRFFPNQDRVVDAHFLCEAGDLLGTGVVHGYAQHLQPLRAIFFLQVHKPRHFYLAGLTPGRPEVKQDGLAAKIRQLNCLAVERRQRKIRGELALQFAGTAQGTRGVVVARFLDAEYQHEGNHYGDNNKDDGIAFHKTPLQDEAVQRRKIAREQSEFSKRQQDPECDQQTSAGDFNGVQVAPKTAVELEEASDSERSQKKRYRQAQRINRQQQNSLSDRVLGRSETQNNT